jgi:flagellin
MRINHNIAALNTYRQLGNANNAQQSSMEKLSSGLRINKAGDDAAGLAISEKMRAQVRGLDQASSNAQDGISLISTAEGALNETHDILQRMRELATQAANDTNTTDDRKEIQKEVNQLTSEINRIGNNTEFNTQKLLNGDKEVAAATAQANVTVGSDIVITASTSGSAYNNYDVVISSSSGAAAGATISGDTLTITLDSSTTMDGAAVSAAIEGSTISAEFEVTVGSGTLAGNETGTLSGGSTAGEGGLDFQIGANNDQRMNIAISDMRATALGISGGTGGTTDVANAVFSSGNENKLTDNSGSTEYALDVTSSDKATAAIEVLDEAIKSVSSERSKLGAYQNRLDHTINNLSTSSENLTAAESRIRDVDMAKEMMEQTKNSILAQASQAMLAQANQQPQGVLQLLR